MVIDSMFSGALAGLLTVLVSEWLMLRGKTTSVKDCWKLSLASSVLRAVCVVAMLVFTLKIGRADPIPFTLSLVTVYLGGLLFEARRYRHWIETK